jgi:hypothetical protein
MCVRARVWRGVPLVNFVLTLQRKVFLSPVNTVSLVASVMELNQEAEILTDDHVSHWCGCEEETCFVQTEYLLVT